MTNYHINIIATLTEAIFECDACGLSNNRREGVILRVNNTQTVLCNHCYIYG